MFKMILLLSVLCFKICTLFGMSKRGMALQVTVCRVLLFTFSNVIDYMESIVVLFLVAPNHISNLSNQVMVSNDSLFCFCSISRDHKGFS